jgi:hypothetical protein
MWFVSTPRIYVCGSLKIPAASAAALTCQAEWAEKFAKMAIERPALKGLRRANRAQWLKPEIRVGAQHLRPGVRSGIRP